MGFSITDIVLAITAITAIGISIVSMRSSKKFSERQIEFSKRQLEHNKDSVRPICSIYQTNYSNLMSVRIENNGTGPLIIKELSCVHKNDLTGVEKKSSSLFELLPEEIKKEKFYKIYSKDGAESLSISAGRRIFLLGIVKVQ